MIYRTAVALALAAVVAASSQFYTEDYEQQKTLFEDFKVKFGKSYESNDEEKLRFSFFLDNLKLADERNAAELKAGGEICHGITKFSDLSMDEFRTIYLTAKEPNIPDSERTPYYPPAGVEGQKEGEPLKSFRTWVGTYTTPIKDQGTCGCCWAFSAVEQMESDAMRMISNYRKRLSVEQVNDCDTTSWGCDGGYTENAYKYVKSVSVGIESETNYPYACVNRTKATKCTANPADFKLHLQKFNTIWQMESMICNYVVNTGPVSVCLNSDTWSTYTNGTLSDCGTTINHCVQAVGVDNSTSTGNWLIRNSWGTDWGINGFIKLKYGENTCNINNDATYTTVYTTD